MERIKDLKDLWNVKLSAEDIEFLDKQPSPFQKHLEQPNVPRSIEFKLPRIVDVS